MSGGEVDGFEYKRQRDVVMIGVVVYRVEGRFGVFVERIDWEVLII